MIAALATWNVADPSFSHATDNPVSNAMGFPGAVLADLSMQFLGLASVFFRAGSGRDVVAYFSWLDANIDRRPAVRSPGAGCPACGRYCRLHRGARQPGRCPRLGGRFRGSGPGAAGPTDGPGGGAYPFFSGFLGFLVGAALFVPTA